MQTYKIVGGGTLHNSVTKARRSEFEFHPRHFQWELNSPTFWLLRQKGI